MKKLSIVALTAVLGACSPEVSTTKTQEKVIEAAQTDAAVLQAEKEARAKEAAARALADKKAMAEEEAMAKKEALAQKAMAEKEALAKETMAKELAAKEAAAKRAAAQQQAARAETARQESARIEAARADAIKQETIRAEAARVEAVRLEAERQEAARAEAARAEAARIEAERAAQAATAYKVLSSGSWRKKSFKSAGNWTLSSENGVTTIALGSGFSTRNAPDLKIFLSPLSPVDLNGRNATQGSLLISPLKSNTGAQSYVVPAGTDVSRYKTILIHCEAYSKLWSVAGL